jgi:transposase-like protein
MTDRVSPMLEEIGMGSQLRKVTKNRSIFPTDTAALKLLYLATCELIKNGQSSFQNGI